MKKRKHMFISSSIRFWSLRNFFSRWLKRGHYKGTAEGHIPQVDIETVNCPLATSVNLQNLDSSEISVECIIFTPLYAFMLPTVSMWGRHCIFSHWFCMISPCGIKRIEPLRIGQRRLCTQHTLKLDLGDATVWFWKQVKSYPSSCLPPTPYTYKHDTAVGTEQRRKPPHVCMKTCITKPMVSH